MERRGDAVGQNFIFSSCSTQGMILSLSLGCVANLKSKLNVLSDSVPPPLANVSLWQLLNLQDPNFFSCTFYTLFSGDNVTGNVMRNSETSTELVTTVTLSICFPRFLDACIIRVICLYVYLCNNSYFLVYIEHYDPLSCWIDIYVFFSMCRYRTLRGQMVWSLIARCLHTKHCSYLYQEGPCQLL